MDMDEDVPVRLVIMDDDDLEVFMSFGTWLVYMCVAAVYDGTYNNYSCLIGDNCFMVPYIHDDEELEGCPDYRIVHEYRV